MHTSLTLLPCCCLLQHPLRVLFPLLLQLSMPLHDPATLLLVTVFSQTRKKQSTGPQGGRQLIGANAPQVRPAGSEQWAVACRKFPLPTLAGSAAWL